MWDWITILRFWFGAKRLYQLNRFFSIHSRSADCCGAKWLKKPEHFPKATQGPPPTCGVSSSGNNLPNFSSSDLAGWSATVHFAWVRFEQHMIMVCDFSPVMMKYRYFGPSLMTCCAFIGVTFYPVTPESDNFCPSFVEKEIKKKKKRKIKFCPLFNSKA